MTDRKRPELLMPAGSLPVLRTAVRYGADAVYIGGEVMSLRAKAKNFTKEDMRLGIAYARERGVKVYVTANIYAHQADIKEAGRYFEELEELRPDGVLVSDPGLFSLAGKRCPSVPRHISTQANTTNALSCGFWADMGAVRIVTARELSLGEISEIKNSLPAGIEIESFIHGAMCISYSGRCLLSSYLAGRDANHGACTHPCRWKYAVVEATRPGEYLPVEENERGTYVFNSRDLCMIDHLPDLYGAGIDSFKVEGRMKTALYVASVARAYRLAMDAYERDPSEYEKRIPEFRKRVTECTCRPFTTGFYYGRPSEESMIYDSNTYTDDYIYLGYVEETGDDGRVTVHQKNKFSAGDIIEVMKPDGRNIEARAESISTPERGEVTSAPHPGEELHLRLSTLEVEEGDILRLKNPRQTSST